MPIYEYQCKRCGVQFEHLQRSRQAPVPACPSCGAERPEKLFSTFSAAVRTAPATRCSLGGCGDGGCAAGAGCPREQ